MEVDEKNRFRLILLTSCAIHFSFILLFPALGISPKFLPEYMEVYLVELPPGQIKPPVESKVITPAKEAEKLTSLKVTLEPKKAAPEVKKPTKTAAGEVSPVKISLPPAQKLPVLPPQVSGIEAPLVSQSLQPTFEENIGPLPRLQREKDIGQGERLLPPGERITKGEEGSPEGFGFPPKVVSPVKEGISYGEEGEGLREEGEVKIKISESLRERVEGQVIISYPDQAEEEGVEGEVELECWVSPDGMVRRVRISRASWLWFNECAEQALWKLGFSPIKGEEILYGTVTFIFEFKKK